MADTFFSLHVHCVFSTKNREPLLVGETRERLWAFMGGIAKRNGVKPILHRRCGRSCAFAPLHADDALCCKTVQLIKGGSSAWIHDTFRTLRNFAWQTGYGAFAVSTSHVPDIIRYIQNQAEHHRAKSFQEEYVGFLKKHGISFEERFLWD